MKNKMICFGICFIFSVALLSGCFQPNITNGLFQFSIQSFEVEPRIINQGETANLSWMIFGAKYASINNGIGNVSLSGTHIIMPSTTTTYILTAFNATTKVSASVELIVRDNTYIILDEEVYKNASSDPLSISDVELVHDELAINITYSGGCEDHEFYLVGTKSFMESYPVQITILLSHNANNDPCDAVIHEQLQYDLTPLKYAWQQAYQNNSGTIRILLEGFENSILYTF
jgi:hypothetical protein